MFTLEFEIIMKITSLVSFLFGVHQWCQVDIFACGNYHISIMEFDILVKNDDKFLNLEKLKIKRKSRNETHKLYGSFTYFKNVTEDIQLSIGLFEKQGGEYRKTPYLIKGS